LRQTKQDGNAIKLKKPHPLRLTVAVLQEAIEKLRKVSARDRFGLDMDGSGKGSSKDDGANGSHADFSFAQQSMRIDEEVEVEEDSAKADTSSVTPPPTQLQVRRTSEGDKQLLRDEPKFSILAYLKGLSCAKAPRGRAPHGTAHQYTYWRGLYGLAPSQSFLEHGGCEPAATSTTEDLEVALRYALANQDNGTKIGTNAAPSRAFLLRFLVKDFVEDGADISFCSAFPHEKEFLYPPLTLMKPSKEQTVLSPITKCCKKHNHMHNIRYGSTTFTIIDVVPHYPGK